MVSPGLWADSAWAGCSWIRGGGLQPPANRGRECGPSSPLLRLSGAAGAAGPVMLGFDPLVSVAAVGAGDPIDACGMRHRSAGGMRVRSANQTLIRQLRASFCFGLLAAILGLAPSSPVVEVMQSAPAGMGFCLPLVWRGSGWQIDSRIAGRRKLVWPGALLVRTLPLPPFCGAWLVLVGLPSGGLVAVEAFPASWLVPRLGFLLSTACGRALQPVQRRVAFGAAASAPSGVAQRIFARQPALTAAGASFSMSRARSAASCERGCAAPACQCPVAAATSRSPVAADRRAPVC